MYEGGAVAVEKQAYREAMAHLGAAVNVITTDGPAGKAGFTASAVTSVTDSPPTLLVCANRTNDSYPAMKANGVLCVNTLRQSQQDLSPVFAGMTEHTMDQRFSGYTWHQLETGAPALDQAEVVFDCRITQVVECGTHDVFFCTVEAVRTSEEYEGLIYYGRDYHKVAIKKVTIDK
ncbi:flavin reductase [Rhodopila sp.]|uniref:flavin reductase n=1 Tax=Rhodopila sp. TaxID=2480087 RepID=UPI0038D164A1